RRARRTARAEAGGGPACFDRFACVPALLLRSRSGKLDDRERRVAARIDEQHAFAPALRYGPLDVRRVLELRLAAVAFELDAADRAVDSAEAERPAARRIAPRLSRDTALDRNGRAGLQRLAHAVRIHLHCVVVRQLRERVEAVERLERALVAAELDLDREAILQRVGK